MVKTPAHRNPRRDDALSRERIVEAAVALLDHGGEDGLTFRGLADALATGPGAIYWHVDNKGELLTAACDFIVARTLGATKPGRTPAAAIRALALGIFDMINRHPWVGSALTRAGGQLPIVRIVERLGQQVQALGVPERKQRATGAALLSYILGVSAQNAAQAQFVRTHGLNRLDFLKSVSSEWARLDADEYPFARRMAAQIPGHDDRQDFLVGVDLILQGIVSELRR